MIDGIELFYQQIAESMEEAIPEEWSSARYEAIFYSGSSTYEAEMYANATVTFWGFSPATVVTERFGSSARNSRRRASQFGGEPRSIYGQMADLT